MPLPILDVDRSFYVMNRDAAYSLAYNKGVHVLVFEQELRRLCKKHGYNHPAMFAQAWHETVGFSSIAWVSRRNPAGIKTNDGTRYQSYYNGVDAARAFVVHMSAYVRPPLNPKDLQRYWYLDERFRLALEANRGKSYETFHDLAGHWAEDPEYGEKIDKIYEGLF